MATPKAGAKVRAADLAGIFQTDTDAWATYVPVWTQGASTISKTVSVASYMKIGRLVICSVVMTATSAGTAASRVQVTLPITMANSAIRAIGSFQFTNSGTNYYTGSAMPVSTTAVIFQSTAVTEWMGATGGGYVSAIKSGDQISFTVMYESAS